LAQHVAEGVLALRQVALPGYFDDRQPEDPRPGQRPPAAPHPPVRRPLRPPLAQEAQAVVAETEPTLALHLGLVVGEFQLAVAQPAVDGRPGRALVGSVDPVAVAHQAHLAIVGLPDAVEADALAHPVAPAPVAVRSPAADERLAVARQLEPAFARGRGF